MEITSKLVIFNSKIHSGVFLYTINEKNNLTEKKLIDSAVWAILINLNIFYS